MPFQGEISVLREGGTSPSHLLALAIDSRFFSFFVFPNFAAFGREKDLGEENEDELRQQEVSD